MKGYALGQGRSLDAAGAAAAMTWSDPVREVALPRRIATEMLVSGKAVHCVWTGRRLHEGSLDIDHCMPWSAWPCGDLWNLMPAHRSVNQRLKRDRLPSSATILRAGGRIRAWWEDAYLRYAAVLSSRFMQEASASLPALGPDAAGVPGGAVFTGVRWQRLRLHRDQGIPEWDAGAEAEATKGAAAAAP